MNSSIFLILVTKLNGNPMKGGGMINGIHANVTQMEQNTANKWFLRTRIRKATYFKDVEVPRWSQSWPWQKELFPLWLYTSKFLRILFPSSHKGWVYRLVCLKKSIRIIIKIRTKIRNNFSISNTISISSDPRKVYYTWFTLSISQSSYFYKTLLEVSSVFS